MPRYFFNVAGTRPQIDRAGEEFPDDEAAWKEATLVAAELFKDIDGDFRPGEEWSLEVVDAQQRPLYAIRIDARRLT